MDISTSEIVINKIKFKFKKLCFVVALIILTLYYNYRNLMHPTKGAVGMKYILQWIDSSEPFIYLRSGQKVFLKNNCPVNNCNITSAIGKYKITDFDAILFHGREFRLIQNLPLERSLRQIYVFFSMESSHYYPVYNERYDNFFNWTWTYKLDSDLYYGYVIVRDSQGNVIGPKKDMHWLKAENMMPINDTLISELNYKDTAVAWLVSNCRTLSKREIFARKLKKELNKYNMALDIYGSCGRRCNMRQLKSHCFNLIKRQYYFYLSFENSFGEDYVTEKLLTPLLNNAVPIVYGGANYTRFLPDGAYLDAKKTGVKKLAKIIFNVIVNKTKYYDFFRWRNHYSYQRAEETSDTNYYCRLCSKLNQNISEVSTHKNFREWWNK